MFKSVSPFLTLYQTFIAKNLGKLVRSILRRYISEELLDVQHGELIKLDPTDKSLWVLYSEVDVALGAESMLKVLKKNGSVSQRVIMEFRMDCMNGLSAVAKIILDKSMKYAAVHFVTCCNPQLMYTVTVNQMNALRR